MYWENLRGITRRNRNHPKKLGKSSWELPAGILILGMSLESLPGITRRNWNPENVLEKLPENYQQKFRTAEKGGKVFRELPTGIGIPGKSLESLPGITSRNWNPENELGKLAGNYQQELEPRE